MDVKTAEFKNNLSKFLRRVRERGETIIIYDRNEPIASLAPISRDQDAEWQRYRTEALARAKQTGLKMSVPAKRPTKPHLPKVQPELACDGRTDISTIDLVRGGRDY